MHAASKQTEQLIETNLKLVETAAQQAAAAVKQAAATDKQADALAQSAQVSHESMILGQRAWVGPNTATFSAEPSVGKPIEILIAYQNTGCQPALQFVSVGDAFSATVAEDAMEQLYKELPNIWKDAKTPLYGKAEASPIQVSDLVPITSAPKPKMNLLTMRL